MWSKSEILVKNPKINKFGPKLKNLKIWSKIQKFDPIQKFSQVNYYYSKK